MSACQKLLLKTTLMVKIIKIRVTKNNDENNRREKDNEIQDPLKQETT